LLLVDPFVFIYLRKVCGRLQDRSREILVVVQ
jgi:hypothetical protein